MDDRTQLMSATPLATGYQLSWYTILEVLGTGGFGVTYLAHDNNLDRDVAIKEYLPTSFAHRHGDQSVKPLTLGQEDNFSWGLANFLKEAKTLAKFSHDNIVRVHSVFEANNTAYMVMEYESGDNLATIIKEQGSISQDFQKRIFYPIIEGLHKIHELGFIHRDIKPANIYIRENGTPVLIDFGSARQTSLQQTSEFTALISQGYTPLEQYSSDYGNQGPWTDIYSLAATIYQGVTGKKPDDSLGRSACMLRSQPDRVARLSAEDYPGYEQQFLDATFAGLNLQPERRPQTLTDWQTLFQSHGSDRLHDRDRSEWSGQHARNGNDTRPADDWPDTNSNQRVNTSRRDHTYPDRTRADDILSDTGDHAPMRPARAPVLDSRPAKKNGKWFALAASLLVAVIGGGFLFYLQQKDDSQSSAPMATVTETTEEAVTAEVTETETVLNQATEESPAEAEAIADNNSDSTTGSSAAATDAAAEPVTSTSVVSDSTPVVTEEITPVEETAAPVASPVEEEVAILFGQPLSNDTNTPARSIKQLADASPDFPPIEGLDESAWKDQNCSNCHTWERENLCTQGEFYVAKDDSALSRIDHPYGGLLKTALKQWAAQGCAE